MKPHIDFCASLSVDLLHKKRVHSRLRKYWGTTTINGIEVFNILLPMWPAIYFDRERIVKATKLFGITEKDILSHGKEGIQSTFLYFNPAKMNTASYNREALANILEEHIPFEEWRVFNITYTDPSDPGKFNGYTKEQILNFVKTNYLSGGMRNGTIMTNGKIDGIDNFLGPYVLFDNGVDFIVEALDASVTSIAVETAANPYADSWSNKYKNTKVFHSGISVSYRYKRIGYLNDDSPVVNAIVTGAQNDRLGSTSSARSLMSYVNKESGNTNADVIWYNGQLRTDIVKTLKTQDYMKVVYGCVDVGQTYNKPKGSFLSKVIGVVLAVVVFVVSGGTAAGASAAVIAASFAAATLTLVVYSMAMAKMGYPGTAAYIGRWAKVTGIISSILGIAASIQSFATKLADTAAASAAAGAGGAAAGGGTSLFSLTTSGGVSVDITAEILIDTLKSTFTQGIGSSPLSMASMASKVIEPLLQVREKNKMKDLASVSAEVKAQEEQLIDLYDKNGHFGVEDIVMYTKPLSTHTLQYEIDWLYEGGPNNILRPSFTRYGMNIISNDIRPITERIRNT